MELNTDEVWQSVLDQLQLQMTRATFDTWLKDTCIISKNNGHLVIGTKNTYAKDWLENRLFNTINRTVADILGHSIDIDFVVDLGDNSSEQTGTTLLQDTESSIIPPKETKVNGHDRGDKGRLILNFKYTFDQFIVGASNRLAHAASLAVAEKPAEAYNPLFLYGGLALAKPTYCKPLPTMP